MNPKTKIWYGLCLFFSIYHLKLLIDDRYLISYINVEKESQLYEIKNYYSVCVLFEEIKSKNRLPIGTGEVPIKTFLNYSITSMEDVIGTKISKIFDRNQSYINNRKLCFSFTSHFLALKDPFVKKLLETYSTFFYE